MPVIRAWPSVIGLAALALSLWLAAARSEPASDPRIASTDEAEVCASDGLPGSAYSRAHRLVHRPPSPGMVKDHTVPLCVGGADVDANIQLQTPDEAAIKDELERFACREVCRHHHVSLREAQGWFLGDWRAQLYRIGR